MDEDLVKENEETQTGKVEFDEEAKKEVLPSKEEIIEKLNDDLFDLKHLYDNVVKENTAITKLSNEYEAKVLELQSLLEERTEEVENTRNEFIDDFNSFERDIAVLESINDELRGQIDNLNSIIEKLISA